MKEIVSFYKNNQELPKITRTFDYYVEDTNGNIFVDTMSGLWCSPLGYSNINIKNSINSQLNINPYQSNFLGHHNNITEDYANKLCDITKMNSIYFTNSGSAAVETAIKIATAISKKNTCAVSSYSYHGSTVLSASASDQSINEWPTVNSPLEAYKFNDAYSLKEILSKNIGFIILEPIVGAGGVYEHSQEIWTLLKQYQAGGGIVILDEVVTGFGKCGSMFAKDNLGVEPDIMTIGKAMSNGYFPLAGCLINARINDQIKFFNHGFTFSGHPVGSAAGLAMLNELENYDFNFKKFNKKINSSKVKEHRIVGCMGAIEFIKRTDALRFVKKMRQKNYIIESASENLNSVCYCLPYIMTEQEFDKFINTAEGLINE